MNVLSCRLEPNMSKLHGVLDFESETLHLVEMNIKLKAEINEEEERLKRLQTQVQKSERDLSTVHKKIDPVAAKKSVDAQVQKLLVLISEAKRNNQSIQRNHLLLKHAPPSPSHPRVNYSKKATASSPSGLSIVKSPNEHQSKCGDNSEHVSTSPTEAVELQLLVQALQVELTRAQVRRQALEMQEIPASDGAHTKSLDSASRIDALAIESLQREIQEMDARLTILDYTQQQTAASFKAQREQERIIADELADLRAQLDSRIAHVQTLERRHATEATAGGAGGGTSAALEKGRAELAALQAEVAALQEENRAARAQAFGGAVVVVRSMAQGEERAAARGRIERLREEAAQLQQAEAAALADAARAQAEGAALALEVRERAGGAAWGGGK
jgi:hypothetical protein